MERSQGHYPLEKEDSSGPCAHHPWLLCSRPKLTALTPGALGSAGLGGSFLPSPELARGAAGSCRQSPLTHRGRGWPPSHCESPWSHQGWQRGGGAGLGLTTLGVKQTKKIEAQNSLVTCSMRGLEDRIKSLQSDFRACRRPPCPCSPCTCVWVWPSS